MKILLLLFAAVVTAVSAVTYDHVTRCTGTHSIGDTDPYVFTNLDTSTGAVFMVEDVNFQIKCCGVLSYWEINARSLTSIDLQVWRRTSTSYELVGFNTVTPTTTGHYIYNVPTSERISVKHGDYIGWFSATTEVISYKTGGNYPIMNRKKTGQTAFAVGDTLNWANENVAGSNRQYSIGAQVVTGDTPTLSIGTNHAKTIDESTAMGDTILTLSVVDDDSLDTHNVNMYSTENGYFEIDPLDLGIKTLQAEIPEGVYEMQIQVIDPCYYSSTSTLTVTVQNTGITINNLPHTQPVAEDKQCRNKCKLFDLDITEATDGWYCDMLDTNNVPFLTRQVDSTAGPEYALYLNSWPPLNFDTKSEYLLTIKCFDDEHTASGTVTISIQKNQDPVFDNLDDTVTIDAKTVVNSHVIFTVSVTDHEADQIIYTMTTTPTGGPFDILDSGKIILTSNLLRHHASASYDLSVTINDGYNTVGPSTLTVIINDINDQPSITNLPADINVIENTALSTSLFTVSVDDLDTSDVLRFSATFKPPEAVKYFTIDSSGVVNTSAVHNIDFDILTDISIEMFIMVTDGKEHDEAVLAIQIQNLNEPPAFSQTHYSISRDEGADGSAFPLTRYNFRDPDAGDTHTYSIDCGSNTSRISINTNTGEITFSGEYDLDQAGTPTDFSCTVNITDYDGLTDSCEIALNIRYVNEYTPTFVPTIHPVTIHNYRVIGTIVTTITATDLDLTDHGTFYYSLTQTYNGGLELFGVLSNGSVYIKDDLSTYYLGATFDVLLKATDTGGLVGNCTIQVTIPQSTTGPPEGTTETPFRYTGNIINTALLSFSALGGVILILLTAYMIINYFSLPKCKAPSCDCCKTSNKPKKPKPPPKKSAPEPPKPASPPPVEEELPLPKPVTLNTTGEQRVAISDGDLHHGRQNSRGERIYEHTHNTPESRDVNRWISEVDNERYFQQS